MHQTNFFTNNLCEKLSYTDYVTKLPVFLTGKKKKKKKNL